MKSSEFLQYLLAYASIILGAFLGVLGNKLVTHNSQSGWKWAFYLPAIFAFLIIPIYLLIVEEIGFMDYVIISILVVSSLCLFLFTKRFLDKKSIYKTSELNPIINDFTSLSDHTEIKLFGGDLNFFGNGPSEMDKNIQYNHLKSMNFKKICILCEELGDASTKIRYGKILHEMNGVVLKFYNPDKADLHIRGRMKTLQGVEKLLIYLKIESGKYQTIETDTANSNGALYNNIWKLIWSLANDLSTQQIDEYLAIFKCK